MLGFHLLILLRDLTTSLCQFYEYEESNNSAFYFTLTGKKGTENLERERKKKKLHKVPKGVGLCGTGYSDKVWQNK